MSYHLLSSRRWIVCLGCGAILLGVLSLFITRTQTVAAQNNHKLAEFMRKKLDASTTILEGLAVEDSELIRRGAADILEMSRAEMWNVYLDDDYREYDRDFRSAIRKLDQAAKEQKFDYAFLQWTDSLKGCIDCHNYVRDNRTKLK